MADTGFASFGTHCLNCACMSHPKVLWAAAIQEQLPDAMELLLEISCSASVFSLSAAAKPTTLKQGWFLASCSPRVDWAPGGLCVFMRSSDSWVAGWPSWPHLPAPGLAGFFLGRLGFPGPGPASLRVRTIGPSSEGAARGQDDEPIFESRLLPPSELQ